MVWWLNSKDQEFCKVKFYYMCISQIVRFFVLFFDRTYKNLIFGQIFIQAFKYGDLLRNCPLGSYFYYKIQCNVIEHINMSNYENYAKNLDFIIQGCWANLNDGNRLKVVRNALTRSNCPYPFGSPQSCLKK